MSKKHIKNRKVGQKQIYNMNNVKKQTFHDIAVDKSAHTTASLYLLQLKAYVQGVSVLNISIYVV